MSGFIGTKLTMNLGERSYDIILKNGALENLYQFARLARRVRTACGRPVPRRKNYYCPAGRGQQEHEDPRKRPAPDARVQHGPRRPRHRRRRRRCGRSGGFCRFHLYARHRLHQLPHHHPLDDRFFYRRQDRCGSGGDEEHRRFLLAAQAGHRGPGHPFHPADPELFAIFEKGDIDEQIGEIIYRSLRFKKSIVEQDETEHGMRKALNFGHTIGHGIEAVKGVKGRRTVGLYHGECVALGMLPMIESKALQKRVRAVYRRLGLPLRTAYNKDKVYAEMLHDKKAQGGQITVIKVPGLGCWRAETIPVEGLRPLLGMED